ncbi:MAG: hypothetical protein MHPSP_004171, partial [Paramarteilia canceri]
APKFKSSKMPIFEHRHHENCKDTGKSQMLKSTQKTILKVAEIFAGDFCKISSIFPEVSCKAIEHVIRKKFRSQIFNKSSVER